MHRPRMNRLVAGLALAILVRSAGWAAGVQCEHDPCTHQEREAQENQVAHHLLRVQQERFETQAREEAEGREKPSTHVGRLDREFKRTQGRWLEARKAVVSAPTE